MSKRDWLLYLAIGMIFIEGGLCTLIIRDSDYPPPRTRENHLALEALERHPQTDHQQYSEDAAAWVAAIKDQGPPPVACDTSADSTKCGEQYNSALDLAAQWVSANATREVVTWTIVQSSLSFFALIGLFWNLRLSREAVAAANETVRATREAAEHQLRAYVHVRSAKRQGEHAPNMEFEFVIHNSGQTPAYDVVIQTLVEVRDDIGPPKAPLLCDPGVWFIGPNSKVDYGEAIDPPLTPEQFADLTAGRCLLVVHGEVTFLDAFGKTQYCCFRFSYENRNISDGYLIICHEGTKPS